MDDHSNDFVSGDDDAHRVSTVVPHKLEQLEEEGKEYLAIKGEEERRAWRNEVRPWKKDVDGRWDVVHE